MKYFHIQEKERMLPDNMLTGLQQLFLELIYVMERVNFDRLFT